MFFSGLFWGACRIPIQWQAVGKGHGALRQIQPPLEKGDAAPTGEGSGKGNFPEEKVPPPRNTFCSSCPVMAPEAAGVAQGALGDAVGRLAAVEKIHDGLGDGRIFVEVVEMAGKGAQVVKGTVQAAGRAADAHIVPHGIADGRPVLRDERRVVVALVAGAFPVGDGVGQGAC